MKVLKSIHFFLEEESRPWEISSLLKFPVATRSVKSGLYWATVLVAFLLVAVLASTIGELLVGRDVLVSQTKVAAMQLEGGVKVFSDSPSLAKEQFILAEYSFLESQESVDDFSFLAKLLLWVSGRKEFADNALQSGREVSNAGIILSTLLEDEAMLKDEANREKLFIEVNNAANLIASAYSRLEMVDPSLVPENYREQFTSLMSQGDSMQYQLNLLKSTSSLLVSLSKSKFRAVVFLQNPGELRATGGFWGTVGEITIDKGQILPPKVTSVYSLDGSVTPEEGPPFPLLAVNDKWYLRDSNWFFNFSDTAKIAYELFEEEAGYTPDAIFALSPGLFENLLTQTGPVNLPDGKVLSAENFLEQIQLETSVNAAVETGRPSKDFLGEVLPVLVERFAKVPLTEKVGLLLTSLRAKDFQVYSPHDNVSEWAESLAATAGTAVSDRDYLAIVSSNLGGTKTDKSIFTNSKLTVSVAEDGRVTNRLELQIKNTLPAGAAYTNTNFLRVFVPEGSHLLHSSGFSTAPDLGLTNRSKPPHPLAQRWENGVLQELSTGTYTGQESGRTYFANWVILDGGEEANIVLDYELPFKLKSPDRYTMLMQRQAGANPLDLEFYLHAPTWNVRSRVGLVKSGINNLAEFRGQLNQDLIFGVVLER